MTPALCIPSRRWVGLALVIVLFLARPQPVGAEPSEQQVQAALVFNVTRFVEWPSSSFRSPGAPLLVGILGEDGVSDVLETMLKRKSVNGHPVEVRRVQTPEEARTLHVLYIAESERRQAGAILKAVRGLSLLTVSDIEHFAELGGHINVTVEDQRVRVFVNPRSARESHLTISAKLMSLAQVVGGER